MKYAMNFLLVAVLFFGAVVPSANASMETAKKEKKACTTCHIKMGKPELNDVGKYYKEHKTLEGYKKKKDKK